MQQSRSEKRIVLSTSTLVLLVAAVVQGGVLSAGYPTALPSGVSVSPGHVALPPTAITVDYVDIGDAASEAAHNMVGWGPMEPFTSGGGWGAEATCRVIWEPGGSASASIDVDFGSVLGTKFLALRWLDGISNGDSVEFTISGVAGTFSVVDGDPAPESWVDLGVWNVGAITGVHTITLTATDPAWGSFNTYGQCALSEVATFVANCWPLVPEADPAVPDLVDEPPTAVQVDMVDIGKPASEAGHGLTGWGPIVGQSVPGSGVWGYEDDCRVIWEPGGGDTERSATINLNFGEAPGHKYIVMRWLDGMANMGGAANDSFTMTVQGIGQTFSLTNGTASQPEKWYFVCAWDVGEITGVRTVTLTATGAPWSAFNTYGQVAFSQIATLADPCDTNCGPNSLPVDVVATPALEVLPRDAVRIDFVDIGDPASEAGHNMALAGPGAWGPIEPQTSGGNYGGEDDCRAIWEAGTQDLSATIDMDFGQGWGTKYLALRWLDGISNQGQTANDSFDISVSGFAASLVNGTASHPETWYDVCVWNVGPLTGVHTVTLTATGTAWTHQGTYGQVAFSSISTYEEFCEDGAPLGTGPDCDCIEVQPYLSGLPASTVMLDYVDIGNPLSEADHNLRGWGGIEPASSGGNYGGEDDCRVIWQKGALNEVTLDGKCASVDLDFGAGLETKGLTLRWLDGIANSGTTMGVHDSFRLTVSGVDTVYTVHDRTAGHGESWYDVSVFDMGTLKGVHTVTLCATGSEWSGFNGYGQVAFSEMATFVACDPDSGPWPVRMKTIIRLPGVDATVPINRCMKLTAANADGCAEPVHVDTLFTGNPATGTVSFNVEDGDWTFVNAKDEQHAVSATTDLQILGDEYYADITLELAGGDTDNDDNVDIDDVAWLIATFGQPANGGTHPWDGTRCADFSNNGWVGTEDFTYLSENWLAVGGFSCPFSANAGSASFDPVRPELLQRETVRITARAEDLPPMVAARADLNGDRVVDFRDVRQFEELHGLGHELSTKIKRSAVSSTPTAAPVRR